jgi:hypothetical protein
VSAAFGDKERLRLEQLQGQAAALRQALALHRDVLSTAADLPDWLKTSVTAIFWEARQLLPDTKYFQHLSASGLNLASAQAIRTAIGSRFDCDAFLAMTEAAVKQYAGVALRIGFHATEQ